ncbi:interferon regulatory factor 10 [Lepisosteus oculatus]|uniref:interferon regulatory factor 10 n=1 Tax=Lepisosteus oculatus TaxID=7918 RepID=UPI00073FC066|nr:PREDICTED: interferon regulatory factor 4-like [Lepisosteus oculatus]
MEDNCRNMRLREWLITQIDSGKYAGLSWENQEKTMFRIPWKHAAKQDYNQNEDAALFKAWAVYKGKYREGKDKVDPSTWKTRLRCALNKSTDFQEVPERSQLDISEPYKVYEILPEGGRRAESPSSPVIFGTGRTASPHIVTPSLHSQFSAPMEVEQEWRERTDADSLHYQPASSVESHSLVQSATPDSAKQVKGKFYSWTMTAVEGSETPITLQPTVCPTYSPQFQISDFLLQVRLYYQGQLVQDFTTSTPEGCRILHGSVPVENERIYGPTAVELLHFPSPQCAQASLRVTEAMARLLPHLERGVLVWVAPDGVFIKRFCQGRVYWDGPLAQHHNLPNKLEREKTCKLLDMQVFLQEVQQYLRVGRPVPHYQIELCFGEEFPDPNQSKAKKLIMAQIEPLFVRKLLMNIQRTGVEAGQRIQPLKSKSDNIQQTVLKQVQQ